MRSAYLSASPLCLKTRHQRCRNVDLLSIAFACALRLRPDLPYADQRCVGNLGLSVSWILTRIVATHAGILTSQRSTRPYDLASPPWQRSPTDPPINRRIPRLRWWTLAPLHFRRRNPRLVSCYALFKGWLLLSQPTSCFRSPTSFHT